MRITNLFLFASLLVGAAASAQPVNSVTLNGPKTRYECGDRAATGPLSGLYRQENGGYLCVLDYHELVLITTPPGDWWVKFTAQFERFGAPPEVPELHGRANVTGYGYRTRPTGCCGTISEIAPCPFEGAIKLRILDGGRVLLMTKPVFIYNPDCCNLNHCRNEVDRLVRVVPGDGDAG